MNYKKVIIFEYEKQIRMTANDNKDKRTKNDQPKIITLYWHSVYLLNIMQQYSIT